MNSLESKTALLFPGQGLQYAGMAKSFYEQEESTRHLFDTIECGFDIKDLCFNGPEDMLRETRYSQACIFMASIAIANALRDKGLKVDAVAGLSLGEYAALCYADSFSVQDGVNLLVDRGRIMADFIPGNSGMAVVDLAPEIVQAYCDDVSRSDSPCEIASYLTPNRVVITGDASAVTRVSVLCRERGARMVAPVNASGAFHSVLAKDAMGEFESVIAQYEIKQPSLPIYYNVDGNKDCDNIEDMLAAQLCKPVQFVETIKNMCEDGITNFIVIGPGASLRSIARDTARANGVDIKTYVIETHDDALKLLEAMVAAQ